MRCVTVLLLPLVGLCCLPGRWSLTMLGVEVPPVKWRGETATLRCMYDMAGASLYSVNWYKDGMEFYRYMPSRPQPKTTFDGVPGANVNAKESDDVQVKLNSLTVASSGEYRCEANMEAPVFDRVSGTAHMLVAVPPESDPVISGFDEDQWAAGDTLELNCTSAKSHPAAQLQWSVHGRLITGDLLTPYEPEQDDEGLQTVTLGLSLHLRPTLLSSGPVHATCTSTVSWNVSTPQPPPRPGGAPAQARYTKTASIQVGSGVATALPCAPLLLALLLLAAAVVPGWTEGS